MHDSSKPFTVTLEEAEERQAVMDEGVIAYAHPVKPATAQRLIALPVDDNTRSEWLWVRFINGDLLMACYPHAETYESVEVEAQWPGLQPEPAHPIEIVDDRLIFIKTFEAGEKYDLYVKPKTNNDDQQELVVRYGSMPEHYVALPAMLAERNGRVSTVWQIAYLNFMEWVKS